MANLKRADNAEGFTLKSTKLYAVVQELDTAVIGLQEVENFYDNLVLQQLVDELTDFMGESNKFEFISTARTGDAVSQTFVRSSEK